MGEALGRLEHLLPTQVPALWESLRPPCAAADLDALRRAVEPHELTDDIVEVLKWRDGQVWTAGTWWPVLNSGRLLSAREAVEHYVSMCKICEPEQWTESWLPITHEGWYQTAIELDRPLRGLVVEGSFPDPPHPFAPSLTAVMHASCELIEEGLVPEPEGSGHHVLVWRRRCSEVLRACYRWYGWAPAL